MILTQRLSTKANKTEEDDGNMKDDKKEVMGTEEQFEEQELIHTQDFESPEVLYQRLINKVKEYHPSDDISMIEKAYNIANNAHKGQLRKSGEPYIIHPLCVALILADLEQLPLVGIVGNIESLLDHTDII